MASTTSTATITIGRIKVAWYTPVYILAGIAATILGIYSVRAGAPLGGAAIIAGLTVTFFGSSITRKAVALIEKISKR